ncbi:MAG: hypothetical protein HC859_02330 [Bacteroidia bacterium]|nr:hypothetical protein [Bacteroidia bacterium]
MAFTRAEKGLMVMAPHPKVKNARNSAGGLLHDAIKSAIQLQQHFNETLQQWRNGTWPVNYTTERPASATLSLRQYTAARWRDKLVIRRSAPGFFDGAPDEKRTRISYGIHLHTILARITYRDDVAASLEKMVFEGLITEQEKGEVFGQLQQLLEHPIVGPWFEPGWEVRTEVPILLPGGEENRIDRLLLKGRQAVVIDFKTGSPAKADQRQVVAYMDVLRQMNFSEVKGYLLYISTGEVVPVPPGRPKVSRQRDASQLGLDF